MTDEDPAERWSLGIIPKADVCKLLSINAHTFYAYRRKYPDHFKTVLIGNRTYMRRETLDRFIAHLEQKQADERLSAA